MWLGLRLRERVLPNVPFITAITALGIRNTIVCYDDSMGFGLGFRVLWTERGGEGGKAKALSFNETGYR